MEFNENNCAHITGVFQCLRPKMKDKAFCDQHVRKKKQKRNRPRPRCRFSKTRRNGERYECSASQMRGHPYCKFHNRVMEFCVSPKHAPPNHALIQQISFTEQPRRKRIYPEEMTDMEKAKMMLEWAKDMNPHIKRIVIKKMSK